MKKLLVIVVLAITASSTLFAANSYSFGTQNTNRFGNFMNGFIGRSKDIQDCRGVIKGDVSPIEAGVFASILQGNTPDWTAIAELQQK